jgi:hypothetical protein
MPRILVSEYCVLSGGAPARTGNDLVSVMPYRFGRRHGSAHRHKFVFALGPANDAASSLGRRWRTLVRSEQGGGAVSEQPNDLVVESMDEAPAPLPIHHEHVRTEGETTVDDALGATDDPTDS